MKKNRELTKIVEAHPHLANNEYIAELSEGLDKAKDVAVVANSDGGKILAKLLKDKCDSLLSELVMRYKEATREELVALIASYEAQIYLYNEFKRAVRISDDLQDEIDKVITGK